MKFIKKVVGIELTSEERKVIEDLANNCKSLCEDYACPDCPFRDFCDNNDAPQNVLTSLLDILTEK